MGTDRYDRQLRLPGFGPPAQDALRHATVLVVGAGGLGCPALLYLAGAGVGTLIVADDDAVSTSNLHRQVLYGASDVGRKKAASVAVRLRDLNPDVVVEPVNDRLTTANVDALVSRADVVLDCCDNLPTRRLLNRACLRGGVPEVWAAIGGWSARCGVTLPGAGPCFECLFAAPADEPDEAVKPPVFGPVCGMAGSLQAGQAIEVLTGTGEPLAGRLASLDARTGELTVIPVARDPRCPACGARRP